MGYISPIGRNWGPIVNWDSLGKLYASIAVAWTGILILGSIWLIRNRNLPFLKIRNIPLAIASVSFLHVYLVKILLAYTVNGHFLCSAEFWIMSIYLPFGIALFQANMVQLLSISTQQRKLLDGDRASIRDRTWAVRGIWSRWRALTTLQKTYFGIGMGMFLQVVIAAAIYGTSRKLQGHWGKIPKPQGQALCRKGLEWIPSALWQLFWCCIYGPYLLYKIRNVHDTHYWRVQTILCVVSGFPGAPLWLAAVFTPGTTWKWVNRYYVPPMWLAPGIFVMQACTIFFPIYEAYHQHCLNKTTASILQTWEDNKAWDDTTLNSGSRSSVSNWQSLHSHKRLPSSADTSTFKESEKERDNQARISMSQYRSNEMYTAAALEKATLLNPTPLLHFAATKDFTAENILFLVAIRDWKAKWFRLRASHLPDPTPEVRRMLWREAVEIYAFGVSERYAEFPINIEWRLRSVLDGMFAQGVKDLRGGMGGAGKWEGVEDPFDAVVPFAKSPSTSDFQLKPLPSPNTLAREMSRNSSVAPSTPISIAKEDEIEIEIEKIRKESSEDSVHGQDTDEGGFKIPEGFNEKVFDAAEKSIKYLVVTNTWRKFVTAMRDGDLRSSQETLA